MAYEIEWSPEAKADLEWLGRRTESLVYAAAPRYLREAPSQASRRRKRMAANRLGVAWALRLDEVAARLYYDIDDESRTVRIRRVGRKVRNRVFVRGVETDMREEP